MSERLREISSGRTEPKGRLNRWAAGRARRREYWAWIGPVIVVSMALGAANVPGSALIVAIPGLLAMIRRLHDLGRSGWFAPLINIATNVLGFAFVALLGPEMGSLLSIGIYLVAMITLGCLPGQPRTNTYGPPPGAKATGLAETFS